MDMRSAPGTIAPTPEPGEDELKEEDMAEPVIAQKSPIPVEVEAGKTYYWCTCGKSAKQPLCDGSHKGSDFAPMAWTAPETKTAYLCACKHTKNAPLCDGSHKAL